MMIKSLLSWLLLEIDPETGFEFKWFILELIPGGTINGAGK
jgi:hypothetical protein